MKKFSLFIALGTMIFLAGCDNVQPAQKTTMVEQQATESNQARLLKEYPVPRIDRSIERAQLIKRAQRINQQNMSGCVYLISYGNIIAMYPVNGKVSSLNSYLTGETQIVKDPFTLSMGGDSYPGSMQVESPDVDGAYGKNADGIFFFTADTDSYVEWQGSYLWSDQCLGLNGRQPALTREVK